MDLYALSCKASFRSDKITPHNAISVLVASCFLELSELAQYCTDYIVQLMAARNSTVSLCSRLKPVPLNSVYPNHKFKSMHAKYFSVIEEACMASLCYSVSRSFLCNADIMYLMDIGMHKLKGNSCSSIKSCSLPPSRFWHSFR